MNRSFPDIVQAVAAVPGDFIWDDADLTVDETTGQSPFARLQLRARITVDLRVRAPCSGTPPVYVFDMLAAGTRDLRALPLTGKKDALPDSFENTFALIYVTGIVAVGRVGLRAGLGEPLRRSGCETNRLTVSARTIERLADDQVCGLQPTGCARRLGMEVGTMTNGSVSLSEVAKRATHVEVACSRCERRGRYRLSRLVARLGEDFPMTDLGSELADCPRRNASMTERCDVYFPGLVKIMTGEDATPKPISSDDDDDY